MTTWLSTPIELQFRVIDGLSLRFTQSGDADRGAPPHSPGSSATRYDTVRSGGAVGQRRVCP